MKKIELGKCPYCNSEDYSRSTDDYQEDYIIISCYCNKCLKSFTEYFSLDEVKFDNPDDEEIDIYYTSNLSEKDKLVLLRAINLLIDTEGDVDDYSNIINVLEGGCNKNG